MFQTKADYIASMRAEEERARKEGYSEAEIKRAYEIAYRMKRNYLTKYALEDAREELKNNKNYDTGQPNN